ncbi:MAG: FAD-dependent oxidoreductase [Firmicutes bacterium]|nr:FAD-dependent oxidoreductase [Bacillota bacterium]
MKLVVIGGVTGGASTAARVRRLDPSAEIVVFERGRDVSFSNCALPYRLSDVVRSSDSLILMDPVDFKERHNIEVKTRHEVTKIDRKAKTVTVKNLNTGKEKKVKYDKLMLAPGASPILPKSIKGIDSSHVFTVRNVEDIERLKTYIDSEGIKDVAVVGGGFIGIEVAENLAEAGKTVRLIEGMPQILAPFDEDMVQILHKELLDNGVELYLSHTVEGISKTHIQASKDGKKVKIPAQAVVMAVGVMPETKLAKDAGLEIGETGCIKVNHNYQTSDPDIYAVGDAVEIYNALAHKPGKLALAGPAQRQARQAADHMYGIHNDNKGYIGSSCLKVFSMNAASTGLNERAAEAAGYKYDSVLLYPNDHVGVLPGSNYVAFKLVFEVPSGKILGAQAISRGEAVKRADVIATMITMGGTLEDLKELELCYSPVYGTAKDIVNMAALVGLNILYESFKQVHVNEVRGLVEKKAYILDVREVGEYKAGHINGSKNIPLSELWNRMNEIPKNKPVYIHCRSGQRSYYALKYLKGHGYKDIYNISGGFLGISYYEYFRDQTEDRKPILDKYNFR